MGLLFWACEGLCGPVLGLVGKGFGLRRGFFLGMGGGFGCVVWGFGVGKVRFTTWCVG